MNQNESFYQWLLVRIPLFIERIRTIYTREGVKGLIKNSIQKLYRNVLFIIDPDIFGSLQYRDWQKHVESRYLNEDYLRKLNRFVGDDIRFSVIFPVWNKSTALLRKALDSVLNQYYQNWELCISDGSTENREDTHQFLKDFQNKHPDKVKLSFLKNPSGINLIENSNQALSLAQGDFCVFLDCDDELSANGLLELALAIKENPEADFLYSDFDKIDVQGRRFNPSFWPDWSPHTLLSLMYTTHVTCFRSSLLEKLGGLREGTEGAQDWDLVLRLSEHTDQIVHIPKILYHWRVHQTSTAKKNSGAKDWAYQAQKKVLSDWVQRNDLNATVIEGAYQGAWRVRYRIKDSPKISILIPFRDKVAYLNKCVKSILNKTAYPEYEIVLINNRSQKQTTHSFLQKISSNEKIRVLDYDREFHFGRLNNWAVEQADGDYVVLLNNDIKVITPEWLDAMLEFAQLPEVGEVGAKLVYPDGKIQHVGIAVGLGGAAAHPHRTLDDEFGFQGWLVNPRNVMAVTGACMMIRRDLFLNIGGFDTSFDPAYQDVDLGIRLYEKGYWNVYTPYAKLCHYESVTRFARDYTDPLVEDKENAVKLRKKWPQYVRIDFGADPFYSPNLSYDHEDMRFRTYWYPEDWGKWVGLIHDFGEE
ncbi:MAG: glycosyltransferase [Candidatus Aminicenantes bacterium]|nr:glycosyltransferase [Candidatus Aminicenantes bacterium]